MIKVSRSIKRRGWYAGLIVIWLFPFALASLAWAATTVKVDADSTGQGWYWKDRPPGYVNETQVGDTGLGVGGDVYCYEVPGQSKPCQVNWAVEHFYVGWDGAGNAPDFNPGADMISGIVWDLEAIPSGSDITSFVMTIMQHPLGAQHNNTPDQEAIRKHGIVACPWPDFFAGSHAGDWEPDLMTTRKCGDAVTGVPVSAAATDPNGLVAWRFNLSGIASEWAKGVNPGMSLEPTPTSKSSVSWITSFHTDSYTEIPPASRTPENPLGTPELKPGVWADVTYILPSPDELGGGFGGDEGSGGFDGDSGSFDGDLGVGSFGDTSGLAAGLGADGAGDPGTSAPRIVASAREGVPAGFWDIPLPGWIALFLAFILIATSGWLLQLEPVEGRPPGAANALMRG